MPRVSIRYQNGTSVEANNLGDALVHLATNGYDYVEDVVEEPAPAPVCKHCDGHGREPQGEPKRVLTRKQIEEKVDQVQAEAPRATHDFDARAKLARSLAS